MRRNGFTLVEVMISMVILSIVALGLGRFAGSSVNTISTSNVRTVAGIAAQQHLENILADVSYPLPASYAGTVTGIAGYPNMVRITVLNRVTSSTPSRDYTVVTVKVTDPTMRRRGMSAPDTVNLSAAVAKP